MSSMMEHLKEALGGSEMEYEPYTSASPEVLKEFEIINEEMGKLNNAARILGARKTLFWAKIELELGLYDKAMKIDVENAMILVEKPKKAKTPVIDGGAGGAV